MFTEVGGYPVDMVQQAIQFDAEDSVAPGNQNLI